MNATLRAALAVLVATAAVDASAQAARNTGPADPSAPAPSLKHESAFEGYRRFEEPAIVSWRAANDEVGLLRGHIDHLKEPGMASDKGAGSRPDSARSPHAPARGHHSR